MSFEMLRTATSDTAGRHRRAPIGSSSVSLEAEGTGGSPRVVLT
jgi:hypothetical protein